MLSVPSGKVVGHIALPTELRSHVTPYVAQRVVLYIRQGIAFDFVR